MSAAWPWSVLALVPTEDLKQIRRAYADKLRAMDIDRDAAAYAALRQARDSALQIAKSAHIHPEPDSGENEDEDDWFDQDWDGEWDTAAGPHQDYQAFEPAIFPEPDDGWSGQREAGPELELDQLLFPGGQPSETPMSAEEAVRAADLQRDLIRTALNGALSQQRRVDFWVADRLAAGWPRSAPLLEMANAAFEWEGQAGQLGEGRTQAFLVSRLRGMRFHEAVLQPGHWAHKAWNELVTPGSKGIAGRFRASKGDIRRLVGGVREHFPELESYFDPRKVESWIGEGEDNPWLKTVTIVIVLSIAFQLLRFIGQGGTAGGGDDELILGDSAQQAAEQTWIETERAEVVLDLFGPRASYEVLQDKAPALADEVKRALSSSAPRANGERARSIALIQLRSRMGQAEQNAGFEELLKIKQFDLDVARSIRREEGAEACGRYLGTRQIQAERELPEKLREQERRLAALLLGKGLLEISPRPQSVKTAYIPGEIVDRVIASTGLSDERVSDAAVGKGSLADRCVFRIALMEQVLRRPGKVSAELLHIL